MPEPDELFLPRAGQAEIPEDKLRGYTLNPSHRTGRHKARVFVSALEIRAADWMFLRDQILDRVPTSAVTAIRPKPPHGVEYAVRVEIDGLNGETHVTSFFEMLKPLDVIELRVAVDDWQQGTIATELEVAPESVLAEVADEDGRTLDVLMVPLEAATPVETERPMTSQDVPSRTAPQHSTHRSA